MNSSIRFTPNQLLMGINPPLIPDQQVKSNNQTATDRVQELLQNRSLAVAALNAIQRSVLVSQWKVGQKVWLEAKNLRLPYGTIKLAPWRHGPFKIIKEISPVAYQLDLPHQWLIHPVFHASLLTAYKETETHGPNFSRPPPDLVGGEEQYEVEAIKNHRRHGRWRQL